MAGGNECFYCSVIGQGLGVVGSIVAAACDAAAPTATPASICPSVALLG